MTPSTLQNPEAARLRIADSHRFSVMARPGYVYIMTNRPNGTLYVGVTSDPVRRIRQHKTGRGSTFVVQYGLTRLVYIESHSSIQAAIAREKRLKRWRRAWKVDLIRDQNPRWADRYDALCESLASGGRLM